MKEYLYQRWTRHHLPEFAFKLDQFFSPHCRRTPSKQQANWVGLTHTKASYRHRSLQRIQNVGYPKPTWQFSCLLLLCISEAFPLQSLVDVSGQHCHRWLSAWLASLCQDYLNYALFPVVLGKQKRSDTSRRIGISQCSSELRMPLLCDVCHNLGVQFHHVSPLDRWLANYLRCSIQRYVWTWHFVLSECCLPCFLGPQIFNRTARRPFNSTTQTTIYTVFNKNNST